MSTPLHRHLFKAPASKPNSQLPAPRPSLLGLDKIAEAKRAEKAARAAKLAEIEEGTSKKIKLTLESEWDDEKKEVDLLTDEDAPQGVLCSSRLF